ncbi:GNAT family N-acetyltransferase [Streptomyces sp. NPDC127098]|uniref:GNAT family N-acetyltransferase n=1 Tax=Streptomyces sp. NPDC127098 TaxID=3347137 RepID=UPI00365BDE69
MESTQPTQQDVAAVRRFNRFFTRRVGVLSDRYLQRARPLGQARLLFEVASAATQGELRERLGLDAGQLSRMLASLESQSLVRTRPDPADRRRRAVELTARGRRELAEQNRRADEFAAGMLTGLTDDQRARLLDSLTTAERLLRLAACSVEAPADPASAAARQCLAAYAAELDERFPEGYDPAVLVTPAQVSGDAGVFALAHDEDRPAGCGAVRDLGEGVGELRHLWVAPHARGLGLGRRLLSELERLAADRGHRVLRLGTHPVLTEAIALYRGAGYREVPWYGPDDPYSLLCFERELPSGRLAP